MDLGTLITGLVMLGLCALPFVLMHFNRKKIKDQMLFSISKMISHENGKLTDFEFTTHAIIGLDENQSKVFMYRKHKDRETRELVKLTDFQRCQIEKTYAKGKSSSEDNPEIERVDLKFIPKVNTKDSILFEFYNSNENLNLGEELGFAKNWEVKINKQMQHTANNQA